MNDDLKKRIAIFRFQAIAALLNVSKMNRGEKETVLKQLSEKEWEIPGSGRSYIGRSTLLEWLSTYQKSGNNIESLYPKPRTDIGQARVIDEEVKLALIHLKKQYPKASVAKIIELAHEEKIIPFGQKVSHTTLYRLFKRHDLMHKCPGIVQDRRRFEAQLPNDLWQSDCMHGPKVQFQGKLKKSFLFAFIDDHSRIIPYAQFYPFENIENYMKCLSSALCKRGLPRKLYVDNGPYFRSQRLQYTTASLGIALIYAKPYQPQGKGKIERWFKTVRMQFLSTISDGLSLEELNCRLDNYINNKYHLNIHSSIGESPLKRYTRHVALLRSVPDNITDYFRIKCRRKVEKDRTVTLKGKLFEAPINSIGHRIDLYYHENDADRVEAYLEDQSIGYLTLLDKQVNSRVKREKMDLEIKNGSLFD